MSKVIKLRKGLNIPIVGEAQKELKEIPHPNTVAISPPDFKGITPKLSVKQGDRVLIGTPLFYDKNNPKLVVVSPVSGTIESINRGEQRKLLEIIIKSDGKNELLEQEPINRSSLTKEIIIERMLQSGLWPMIIQRPFGIIANPNDTPRDIFVSCFDTSPLAPDLNFIISQDKLGFFSGIEILRQLTSGNVHLGIDTNNRGIFDEAPNVAKHYFEGPHPAGNVGIQIHHVSPIGKGDLVWTVHPEDVLTIGRYFLHGRLNFSKIVAITGSEAKNRFYAKTIAGVSFETLLDKNFDPNRNIRFISGNPLTGTRALRTGYLGFYHHQVTLIPEGDYYEFMGWAAPRFNKFSTSRTYFSWLFPNKKYVFDTNLHGDERAFVMTGEYERFLPMDILPVFLLKAIITKDIEQMENLGIYEVIEEDFALCEFACTSKIKVQKLIKEGIDLMIKELT